MSEKTFYNTNGSGDGENLEFPKMRRSLDLESIWSAEHRLHRALVGRFTLTSLRLIEIHHTTTIRFTVI